MAASTANRWCRSSARAMVVATICAVPPPCGVMAGHWAGARPPAPQWPSGPTPFPDACGDPKSPDGLWNDVGRHTAKPGSNRARVVWPNNDQSFGYAIHIGGAQGGAKYNWLLGHCKRTAGGRNARPCCSPGRLSISWTPTTSMPIDSRMGLIGRWASSRRTTAARSIAYSQQVDSGCPWSDIDKQWRRSPPTKASGRTA